MSDSCPELSPSCCALAVRLAAGDWHALAAGDWCALVPGDLAVGTGVLSVLSS